MQNTSYSGNTMSQYMHASEDREEGMNSEGKNNLDLMNTERLMIDDHHRIHLNQNLGVN